MAYEIEPDVKLNSMQNEIIYAIAKAFPFSVSDVENAYRYCGSFDKTILAAEFAASTNTRLFSAACAVK